MPLTHYTPFIMRSFLTLILAFITLGLSAQVIYEIDGPAEVLCVPSLERYQIYTSDSIFSTEWSIFPTPGAEIVSSNTFFANIQFNASGTYFLSVFSQATNGTILSDSMAIYVFQEFGGLSVSGCNALNSASGCYQVCTGGTSVVTTETQGSQWIVSGAESFTILDGNSIEITWGAPGPGSVFAENFCSTTPLCFEILPVPVADFDLTPMPAGETLTVCRNQEIYFENTSENGLDYLWEFGDGSSSTSFDEVHRYGAAGIYTATLTASSVCECSDEKSVIIEVLPAPAPVLDCVNSVCPETRQRYTAMTDGCTNFNWSVSSNGTIVNGGETSDDFIEVIWHSGPDGWIELSVSSCNTAYCSFTNRFRIPIISPDGPVQGDPQVCAGELATYEAPYFPGTQYNWQVGPSGMIVGGQGSNALRVLWANVNALTMTSVGVTYENCFLECGGQDLLNVEITPRIQIAGDVQVCAGEEASISAEAGFGGSAIPAPVQWQLEDASGAVLITEPGLNTTFNHVFNYPPGEYFWVALNTSTAYCNARVTQRITVSTVPDVPLGILGEDEICPGVQYGYTIEEAGNFGTRWTIIDGINTVSYEGQSITHAFGITPPYLVTATHVDIQFPDCESPVITKALTSAADKEIVGNADACLYGIEEYTIDYIGGSTYAWEVLPAGNGEIRKTNSNTVEIFWTGTGMTTIQLTTCGVVIDKLVEVHSLPDFNVLGPAAVCGNEQVAMSTDQSSLAHTWFNEDGAVLGSGPAIDLFPGYYSVELTDAFGCSTEKSFGIMELPAPKVHLSSPTLDFFCGTIPNGIPLVANTDGDDYQFTWYLNDVDVGNSAPTYSGTAFGTYRVEVTNSDGCTASSSGVTIGECCPVEDCIGGSGGGNGPGCPFLEFDFEIEVAEDECQEKTYTPLSTDLVPGSARWTIGSLSRPFIAAYSTDVAQHAYALPGYYKVALRAKVDGFGYPNTQCTHLELFIDTVRLVADFSHGRVCEGEPVTFEDLTTFLPGESITGWAWDFGDPASGANNTSTDQHPVHTFSSADSFDVTLTVTLASGCASSKVVKVGVSSGPELQPEFDLQYCEDEAAFFNLPGQVFEVEWNFDDPASGDENTAEKATVFHTFADPALYSVTVSAADILTCRAQAVIPIEIKENTLAGDITVDPSTALCVGDTATLSAPPVGEYWLWSNGVGNSVIEVAESDQYSVFIRDAFNCTYTTPAEFIEFHSKPSVLIQAREVLGPDSYGPWQDNLQLCDQTSFEIHAFATGNVTFQWSNGPTTQAQTFAPESANLPGPGQHTFTVVVTDVNGCASEPVGIPVEIYPLPNQPQIALSSGSACSFDLNSLEVTNPEAGVTYLWSDGQTGTLMQTAAAGEYFVTAISPQFCISISSSIEIQESAPVDRLPGGCFVECDPLTVCLPPLSNVTAWTIYQDGSVFNSGTIWPGDFQIDMDGSYTIEVVTANGCVALSDPLDVMLYSGVGVITVSTYLDSDGDGTVSAGDALLGGIPMQIESSNGMYLGSSVTGPTGQFDFRDYPAENYLVTIDQNLLSSQWKIVIDSLNAEILTCEDSVHISLLLMENCVVNGPQVLLDLCPGDSISIGDSTWTGTGNFELHSLSANGCDSVNQITISLPDSIVITTNVWWDVDGNGGVSSMDTLVPGIGLILEEIASGSTTTFSSGPGSVSLSVPVSGYLIELDTLLLPPEISALISSGTVALDDCGEIVIDLLVEQNCVSVIVAQQFGLCPGDSILVGNTWIDTTGSYTVLVSDTSTACDTFAQVEVSVYPEMTLTGEVTTGCDQGSFAVIAVNAMGDGPFTYSWSQNLPGDSLVVVFESGIYTVVVTDQNGCSASQQFIIDSLQSLNFSLPPQYSVLEGDTVELSITGDILEPGLTVQWAPSVYLTCDTCFATAAFPAETTPFSAVITDAMGCSYSLETVVHVLIDSTRGPEFYLPNIFSPNNDGQNDRFMVFSEDDEAQLIEMVVLDRWGNRMFTEKDNLLASAEGWDGNYHGQPAQPQVYVYLARVRLSNGTEKVVYGDVLLVR